jgi:putative molybdopterin biosynthesis protein
MYFINTKGQAFCEKARACVMVPWGGRMPNEIDNRLGLIRQKRGLAAAELAQAVGASRQTIYAIEAGTYVPNTVLALKLAQVLETSVEELFALTEDAVKAKPRYEQVTLLPGSVQMEPGQPVQLCRVGRRLIASPPSPARWYLPASDGVAETSSSVRLFHPQEDFRNRLLIAGCDPAISVLARHAEAAGIRLVMAHRNSSQALELLKQDAIHIAGTHLRDESSGESNIPEIQSRFSGRSAAVFSFAVWEEGFVTAPGNPKQIKSVVDLARPGISIVNRELGSGARRLLDSELKRAKIPAARVAGYGSQAPSHLAAAWQVHAGAADCCIATRTAARAFGLGFVPLVAERYDLVLHRRCLKMPSVQTLFDILSRADFRRELEVLGGYDMRSAGARIL